MQGYQVLAKCLSEQQVQYVYGIVGIPVIQLGFSMQANGINYYGFRNEQQAAYSAGFTGYLTGRPGGCLCVSGPGHTNAISGVMNAWINTWPMILISGSNDISQTSYEAFQQCDQVYFVKPYTKYSVRVLRAEHIPYHVQKAVRLSITGRPGPVFLDMPGDVLNQTVTTQLEYPIFIMNSTCVPTEQEINKAINLLREAEKPLVIVGKGAAYSCAENQIRQFIKRTQIPFLPTPMGKGVIPDSHILNVSAARSTALKQADLIILLGARLNWILHFGLPPRFNKGVKIIQADICLEQMGHNVQSSSKLIGDLKYSVLALNKRVEKKNCLKWIQKLSKKAQSNKLINDQLMNEKIHPMTYYTAYGVIRKYLPEKMILIGEGANTMDIGRTIFTHEQPRCKLDAGSFGTMGIGLPAIISARTTTPNKWAVAVMGDSAFGFSAMQSQTLTRYKLGAVIFIINNNGIYSGTDKLQGDTKSYGVTFLNPQAHYEKLAQAFGGQGIQVTTPDELELNCKKIFSLQENMHKLFIINVRIEPSSTKKTQQNQWLTRKAPDSKL